VGVQNATLRGVERIFTYKEDVLGENKLAVLFLMNWQG
jgi:hypothetical protein